MKKLLFLGIILLFLSGCKRQISAEQQSCERAVLEDYNCEGCVNVNFSNFSQATVTLDSLRKTGTLALQSFYVRTHALYIEKYQELIERGEDCGDVDCEEELDFQREMLAIAEEELRGSESLFTAVNYVIDFEYVYEGELNVIRFYLNDRYEVMSRSPLVSNGEIVEISADKLFSGY